VKFLTGRRRQMLSQLVLMAGNLKRSKGAFALLDWGVWLWQLRRLGLHESYQNWIAHQEAHAATEGAAQVSASESDQPWLSFITPVYNTPPDVLRATLDSVRAQAGGWELCATDASDIGAEASQVLAEYAQIDNRIRVLRLADNQGISGNSNQAIAMAQGKYLALLDHDDLLALNMVSAVHALVTVHPDADIIYYDEDKLTADGQERHEPWFKPHTWSPDMLLCANFLMHSVVRRRLAEDAGLFDPRTDGAQDWDLMLRCSERTEAIYHIPKVLYHWRQVEGSTAESSNAKPWVFDSQRQVLLQHLRRLGIAKPEISQQKYGYQVSWPVCPAQVSVIVTSRNAPCAMHRCLTLLQQEVEPLQIEVLVVDKSSRRTDVLPRREALQGRITAKIIQAGSPGEADARNLGARQAQGDLLLFLDECLKAETPRWMEEMARWTQRPQVGAVGSKLFSSNGRVRHAGLVLGQDQAPYFLFQGAHEAYSGFFGAIDWYRTCYAVSGDCLMVSRKAFWEAGGFDEDQQETFFQSSASSEGTRLAIGLCVRLREHGLRTVYTPYAALRYHCRRKQTNPLCYREGNPVQNDDFGNPNLVFDRFVPCLPDTAALLQ